MIKKLSIIACFALVALAAQAQHNVTSFFDEYGSARIQTEEFSRAHDTIVMVDHRIDDVIWARYVYRIIDLRYRQNFQLYFPAKADDPDYRSLFKVILDAVVDGMPIYRRGSETIKPEFRELDEATEFQPATRLPKEAIPLAFMVDDPTEDHSDDEDYYKIDRSNAMLINYDSITDIMRPNLSSYELIVKNQVKYLIQEVVFFDKHTSRLHSKIIAIAPLHAELTRGVDEENIMEALRRSIMFWIPFDQLRPYMAMQYAIPNRNETKRVTYDEFFQKRLFTSYIVGEGNMYNRWIPDYSGSHEEIKKEQERIATELLNFEQDLWEY